MTTPIPPRYRMIVALDRSEYADVVLEHALDLAARHDPCDLHFLVVHDDAGGLDDAKRGLADLVRDGMETFRAVEHDWAVHLHARSGDSADQIAALAGEAQADLIVMGRFGVHPAPDRLGGVTDRVLAQAPCSTLVVQLTDRGIEQHAQCPACVEVRRASAGERWFCDAHVAPDRAVVLRLPRAFDFTEGGLMW